MGQWRLDTNVGMHNTSNQLWSSRRWKIHLRPPLEKIKGIKAGKMKGCALQPCSARTRAATVGALKEKQPLPHAEQSFPQGDSFALSQVKVWMWTLKLTQHTSSCLLGTTQLIRRTMMSDGPNTSSYLETTDANSQNTDKWCGSLWTDPKPEEPKDNVDI